MQIAMDTKFAQDKDFQIHSNIFLDPKIALIEDPLYILQ